MTKKINILFPCCLFPKNGIIYLNFELLFGKQIMTRLFVDIETGRSRTKYRIGNSVFVPITITFSAIDFQKKKKKVYICSGPSAEFFNLKKYKMKRFLKEEKLKKMCESAEWMWKIFFQRQKNFPKAYFYEIEWEFSMIYAAQLAYQTVFSDVIQFYFVKMWFYRFFCFRVHTYRLNKQPFCTYAPCTKRVSLRENHRRFNTILFRRTKLLSWYSFGDSKTMYIVNNTRSCGGFHRGETLQ